MSHNPISKSKILITTAKPVDADFSNEAKMITPMQGGLKISMDSLATEDSGRTADGVMHIQFIKSDYKKLQVTLPPSTYTEIARVTSLCLGKRRMFVTFFDPYLNAEKTIIAYNSNSDADVYSGVVHNGLIQGFAFSLIDTGETVV